MKKTLLKAFCLAGILTISGIASAATHADQTATVTVDNFTSKVLIVDNNAVNLKNPPQSSFVVSPKHGVYGHNQENIDFTPGGSKSMGSALLITTGNDCVFKLTRQHGKNNVQASGANCSAIASVGNDPHQIILIDGQS